MTILISLTLNASHNGILIIFLKGFFHYITGKSLLSLSHLLCLFQEENMNFQMLFMGKFMFLELLNLLVTEVESLGLMIPSRVTSLFWGRKSGECAQREEGKEKMDALICT